MENTRHQAFSSTEHGGSPHTLRPAKAPLSGRRSPLQRKVLLIPSCITVVAFFSGFLAVIMAIRGNFEYAAKCIAMAIIFDGLDGRVARRLNATTAFGREFDSLSDVVAFGVAPAILLYQWAFSQTADEFGVLASFLFVVCCGARLARFNIAEESHSAESISAADDHSADKESREPLESPDSPSGQSTVPLASGRTASGTGSASKSLANGLESFAKKNFQGLPTPGSAAAIASAVYLSPALVSNQLIVALLATYAIIMALLMVSSMPFLSIKHVKLTQKNAKLLLPLLAAGVALAWYHSRFFFFIGSICYVSSGPVLEFLKRRNARKYNPSTI